MDEADKRELSMSEYVLLILETNWSKLNEPPEENSEILALRENLTELKKALQDAQIKVIQLKEENAQLVESLSKESKTLWQEATETTNKLSQEHIQRQIDVALNGYRQQLREQSIANDNHEINLLNARLELYETPLLKGIFNILNRTNRNIRDLPDIVTCLTNHYYHEVIVPNQFQQPYYHV
ncbi:hypothetical protein VB796_14705 [Arcicella sp. LKC2W]|uniref:hypothetical protein n=1 Tax=Arcicella sp. LKC2W TaxID=2984198 RepID=UPI002B20A34A|nr:hypothetical protein [Arcicella sp. LKC2W]MEA5460303.1 hypothetical protein [Arcicella sp. LKC2W]